MRKTIILTTMLMLVARAASGAALHVAPVSIEMPQAARATTLTLRNNDARPINVQIRIFRWSQRNGEESLEPTTDVVVSPPMTTMDRGAEYVVRVIRTRPEAPIAEESYRILIDELPEPPQAGQTTVRFALRYSIPVFFEPASAIKPAVSWAASHNGGNLMVQATNAGGRRLKLSNVKISDQKGALIAQQSGLVGYVLGRTAKRFQFQSLRKDMQAGQLTLTGESDTGPFNVVVSLQPQR